jgi:hypothetical protein
MMRSVNIRLGRFAFEALAGGLENGSRQYAPVRMAAAVRCYLGDRGRKRPGWAYPPFLLSEEEKRGEMELEVSIEDELWRSFEDEAGRQGVSVGQMSEHAALYLAAEVNAGRITQRILDDLAPESSRGRQG